MPNYIDKTLRGCFHSKKGKPNLHKVPVNIERAKQHIGKANPEYLNYIKRSKQLEQKYTETLEKAQEDRVIEQYGVEVITNDDAEWIIEDAGDFVLKIEEVIAE